MSKCGASKADSCCRWPSPHGEAVSRMLRASSGVTAKHRLRGPENHVADILGPRCAATWGDLRYPCRVPSVSSVEAEKASTLKLVVAGPGDLLCSPIPLPAVLLSCVFRALAPLLLPTLVGGTFASPGRSRPTRSARYVLLHTTLAAEASPDVHDVHDSSIGGY